MAGAWLIHLIIVFVTVVAMEAVATGVHHFVMHGIGWRWHESHHSPRAGWFEVNDLYALLFTAISIGMFMAGARYPVLWWIGLGLVVYGLLYGFVHDGLVHRRVPSSKVPRSGYLKRLVQAHRLHHAVKARDGAVSFGFLYAPPVDRLLSQLRAPRRNG